MNIFKNILNNLKSKITEGVYRAVLISVTLATGTFSGRTASSDTIIYRFAVIEEEADTVQNVEVKSFYSDYDKSDCYRIAELFADRENKTVGEITSDDVVNNFYDISLKIATSKQGNDYLTIADLTSFSGSDEEKKMLEQVTTATTASAKPEAVTLIKPKLSDGTYDKVRIKKLEIKETVNGNEYILLYLEIFKVFRYTVPVAVFPEQSPDVIRLLADVDASDDDSDEPDFSNSTFTVELVNEHGFYKLKKLALTPPVIYKSIIDMIAEDDEEKGGDQIA